jgi:hypothetical protein
VQGRRMEAVAMKWEMAGVPDGPRLIKGRRKSVRATARLTPGARMTGWRRSSRPASLLLDFR